MTQSDLAEKFGTPQETVSRQIGGNPTLKTLGDISDALGVHIRELFTMSEDETGIYGYVEYQGEVHKIVSVEDLEKLLSLVHAKGSKK